MAEWLWRSAGMTEVIRVSQTKSEGGRKQQPLLHYGSPSRLCYFNLALKGDDAATRVNALSLERKIVPMSVQLERAAQLGSFFVFFFGGGFFPPFILRSLWQKGLASH